jgi:hypothetical protein
LLPFKFISDTTCPMKPLFCLLIKGKNDGMHKTKAHWNFIQSS